MTAFIFTADASVELHIVLCELETYCEQIVISTLLDCHVVR